MKTTTQENHHQKAVLCCMLLNPSLIERMSTIPEAAFRDTKLHIIFRAIKSVYKSGHPVDLISVTERLDDDGNLTFVSAFLVTDVYTHLPSSAHWQTYSALLIGEFSKRK